MVQLPEYHQTGARTHFAAEATALKALINGHDNPDGQCCNIEDTQEVRRRGCPTRLPAIVQCRDSSQIGKCRGSAHFSRSLLTQTSTCDTDAARSAGRGALTLETTYVRGRGEARSGSQQLGYRASGRPTLHHTCVSVQRASPQQAPYITRQVMQVTTSL